MKNSKYNMKETVKAPRRHSISRRDKPVIDGATTLD